MALTRRELRRLKRACVAVFVALLPVFAGCDSGRVPTYSAQGTVRFAGGEPVRFGMVEFDVEGPGLSSRGRLDEAGRFELGTFSPGDGAPAGEYRVIVVQTFDEPTADKQHRAAHQTHTGEVRVSPRFAEYRSTPLRATVQPQDGNRFEFEVTRINQRADQTKRADN